MRLEDPPYLPVQPPPHAPDQGGAEAEAGATKGAATTVAAETRCQRTRTRPGLWRPTMAWRSTWSLKPANQHFGRGGGFLYLRSAGPLGERLPTGTSETWTVAQTKD